MQEVDAAGSWTVATALQLNVDWYYKHMISMWKGLDLYQISYMMEIKVKTEYVHN